MKDLNLLGIVVEQNGQIKFIKATMAIADESHSIDLSPSKPGTLEDVGITDPISPEEVERLDQPEFEEGLDKRLKRK